MSETHENDVRPVTPETRRDPSPEDSQSHHRHQASPVSLGELRNAGSNEAPELAEASWGPLISLVMLGTSAGFIVSSYLASCGYFQLKFHSTLLFGLQTLTTYVISLVVALLQELFDDRVDHAVGAKHAWGFRIIFGAAVGSLVSVLLPACQGSISVLVVGSILCFFAFSQFSSAMSLGATAMKGGNVLVSFGFTLGGALPLLTTHLVHYAPGCSLARAFIFHAVGSGVALVCVSFWTYEHMAVAMQGSPRSTDPIAGQGVARRPSATGVFMLSAYQTLATPRVPGAETDGGGYPHWWGQLRTYATPTVVYIFLANFMGFMLLPLFTLGTPIETQRLYLLKCVGDLLGRAVATGHALKCSDQGYVDTWVRVVTGLFLVLRILLSVLLILSLLHDSIRHFSRPFSVVVLFALGSYGMLMVDLSEQFEGGLQAWRKSMQRRNTMAQFAGQLAGIGAGLALHFGDPPPR